METDYIYCLLHQKSHNTRRLENFRDSFKFHNTDIKILYRHYKYTKDEKFCVFIIDASIGIREHIDLFGHNSREEMILKILESFSKVNNVKSISRLNDTRFILLLENDINLIVPDFPIKVKTSFCLLHILKTERIEKNFADFIDYALSKVSYKLPPIADVYTAQ